MRALLALLLAGWCSLADARDMVLVILNPNTQTVALERADIADLFLGCRQVLAGGIQLVPVDTRDEALREQFYQRITGMSSNRVRAYWARRVFSSQGRPPKELNTDDAARAMLHETGTLIYAFADRVPVGGRVLLNLGAAD